MYADICFLEVNRNNEKLSVGSNYRSTLTTLIQDDSLWVLSMFNNAFQSAWNLFLVYLTMLLYVAVIHWMAAQSRFRYLLVHFNTRLYHPSTRGQLLLQPVGSWITGDARSGAILTAYAPRYGCHFGNGDAVNEGWFTLNDTDTTRKRHDRKTVTVTLNGSVHTQGQRHDMTRQWLPTHFGRIPSCRDF
jgi:hypothetical protein